MKMTARSSYFSSIGMGELLIARAESVITELEQLLPPGQTEQFLFICDTITSEGKRVYTNLWLITEDFMCEAKNFPHTDDFDITSQNKLRYVSVHKSNMPNYISDHNSQLKIQINFNSFPLSAEFTATGNNCERLFTFFKNVCLTKLAH